MRYSEVVDSVKSLKEFIKVNKIIPKEIIVVWDEIDEIFPEPSEEVNKKGLGRSYGYDNPSVSAPEVEE